MSEDTSTLSKADRLAIAGQAAPAVRRRAAAPRRVTVVDRDGKPVRVTDDVEIAKGLLARADIEFSVQEGAARDWRKCSQCSLPFKKHTGQGAGKGAKGIGTKVCEPCRKALSTCEMCEAAVPIASGYGAKKKGRLPRCRKHRRTKSVTHLRPLHQKRSAESLARRLAESVCRVCRAPLKPPSNAVTAAVLRRMFPEGRRCRSCGNKAQRAARAKPNVQITCACGTPIQRKGGQCRACWRAHVPKAG